MKKGMIAWFTLIVLLGCSAVGNENQKNDLENLRAGQRVYACGCPMMCCNSISRNPEGRCACNNPLKEGVITKILDNRIYVKVSGREKMFLMPITQ